MHVATRTSGYQLSAKRAASTTTFFVYRAYPNSRQYSATGLFDGDSVVITMPTRPYGLGRTGFRFHFTAEGTNDRPAEGDRAPDDNGPVLEQIKEAARPHAHVPEGALMRSLLLAAATRRRAMTTRRGRIAAVALLAVFALVAAGCGSSAAEPTAPADAVEQAPAVEDDDGLYEDDEGLYEAAEDDEALAHEEWEYQEGEAWEQFDEGYLTGWEAGCDIAFEGSPDGYLYLDGDQYSAEDCYALAPFDASDADVPYGVPYDPYSEGEALGETDGCNAAFDELSYEGALYWGEDYYDSSVCP